MEAGMDLECHSHSKTMNTRSSMREVSTNEMPGEKREGPWS